MSSLPLDVIEHAREQARTAPPMTAEQVDLAVSVFAPLT